MGEAVSLLVIAGALAVVMGLFTWLASIVRRRGAAGTAISAALASYDEAFRVTAHESHYEIRAQTERKAPAPSPDDPWRSAADVDRRSKGPARPSRRPRSRRRWWGGRRPGRGPRG
ncbi:hypothetical protein [Streptomyces sp. NPDC059076]|uniref:hypothetical protein n=1 Tax=unclassified Streptomyces TaxID=2593676 RepID=UPI0036C7ACE4